MMMRIKGEEKERRNRKREDGNNKVSTRGKGWVILIDLQMKSLFHTPKE